MKGRSPNTFKKGDCVRLSALGHKNGIRCFRKVGNRPKEAVETGVVTSVDSDRIWVRPDGAKVPKCYYHLFWEAETNAADAAQPVHGEAEASGSEVD